MTYSHIINDGYEAELNRKIKDSKFYVIEIQMDEDNIAYYENEFKTKKEADFYGEKFGSNFVGVKGSRLKNLIKKGKAYKGAFDILS